MNVINIGQLQKPQEKEGRSQFLEEAKTITLPITNTLGLHARPAAMFVRVANKYKNCEIFVMHKSKRANGKSIMGIMTLEAGQGSVLTVTAKGENVDLLLKELEELVNDKFGED